LVRARTSSAEGACASIAACGGLEPGARQLGWGNAGSATKTRMGESLEILMRSLDGIRTTIHRL